jgi:hydroxymethylpyrimidine pyrophosphatase-like HAD family hydrolase
MNSLQKVLPLAIICDLDGTLALLNGRSPYDASTCEQDVLNKPVADIVRRYLIDKDVKVFFVSGREDKFKRQTDSFISVHFKDIPELDYRLIMRKSGDYRKDSEIKKEIYDKYIRGKYDVLFVLDDRDQVVKYWRSEGLTCLQVDYGNF